MDKSLIEGYKKEMIRMYANRGQTVSTAAKVLTAPTETTKSSEFPTQNDTSTGSLVGVATQLRSLYFVPNTKVTVFTGTVENMENAVTGYTDENGKTEIFTLPAPLKSESLKPQNAEKPYSLYNMMFEADGYITNIHLNIPVFSGVTSRQTSNLILLETAGVDKGPHIFDEFQNYNL